MSDSNIVLLSMSWVFLIIFMTPASLAIFLYQKVVNKLPTGQSFIKGFKGWFYVFLILCAISAYNIVNYHPAFA